MAAKQPLKNDWSSGVGCLPGRKAVGPIFLMLVTPVFSIVYSYVCRSFHGDFLGFAQAVLAEDRSLFDILYSIWPDPYDPETLKILACFMAFEILLMKFAPGKPFVATITPTGHRPVYKANGMASYVITLLTLISLDFFGIYSISRVYDKFGNILSSMNVFALIFCAFLTFKGYVAPSSTDHGSNGDIIYDFYWGMELYPKILTIDVKQFTNCRFGMMAWPVSLICFCYKNMELNNGTLQYGLAVSTLLQLVYCFKFFHWEMGYMCSMDIQHDRAGYYICWGCLVWVPAVYTSAGFYLTNNAPYISLALAAVITVCGWICIWMNYESDHQRYVFRQTNGNCLIWGHKPQYIEAKYEAKGQIKTSLLLVDGYWAISRHFHYMPEILASFFWSVPALNTGFLGPYFYVIFLTILLTDRAFRDDSRCQAKYRTYWDEYCDKVPYKIVPGIV